MRVSTTVDRTLLTRARQPRAGVPDATLLDEALAALLARHRAGEVVNLDAVESVSLGLLVARIGRLSDARMEQVCAALEIAVDCQR